MPTLIKEIKLYTVEEVAVATDLHKNTVYDRIKSGDIQAHGVKRAILVEHEELVRYLKESLNLPEHIIEYRLKREKNG